uniref:hypothetical protein n=1 Tax=Ruminococcus sp. TaxID=41978 RepID=UPI0039679187
MAFNNKNNRITVKGFLSSELKEIPNASFALTFMIKVPRNSEKKKRVIYDEFTIASAWTWVDHPVSGLLLLT